MGTGCCADVLAKPGAQLQRAAFALRFDEQRPLRWHPLCHSCCTGHLVVVLVNRGTNAFQSSAPRVAPIYPGCTPFTVSTNVEAPGPGTYEAAPTVVAPERPNAGNKVGVAAVTEAFVTSSRGNMARVAPISLPSPADRPAPGFGVCVCVRVRVLFRRRRGWLRRGWWWHPRPTLRPFPPHSARAPAPT